LADHSWCYQNHIQWQFWTRSGKPLAMLPNCCKWKTWMRQVQPEQWYWPIVYTIGVEANCLHANSISSTRNRKGKVLVWSYTNKRTNQWHHVVQKISTNCWLRKLQVRLKARPCKIQLQVIIGGGRGATSHWIFWNCYAMMKSPHSNVKDKKIEPVTDISNLIYLKKSCNKKTTRLQKHNLKLFMPSKYFVAV
jgi:hypothetical protein